MSGAGRGTRQAAERGPGRAAIGFILATVVIDAIGFGLILPVLPALIMEVSGDGLAEAAIWGGLLTTAYAAMQFLFGPVLGNASDRWGRRPVLLLSLAVMAADYLVLALAPALWLLFVARIVAGIAAATQATAMAFMADISPPERKSQNFGLIGAAFGLGFVLGPAIGGLLGEFGTRAPFYAAAVLAGLNLLLGAVALPETVTEARRRPFSWRRANPVGALADMGRLAGLRPMLAVFFLSQIAFYVYPVIWAYFTQARFGWGPGMVGLSLASFGVAMALVQGVLLRLVVPRVGDRRAVMAGFALSVLGLVGYGFVTEGWMAFVLVPVAALGGLTGPALQGIMSRMAGERMQGALQGALTSTTALATILSPLIMTRVFHAFAAEDAAILLPGAPFLLAAMLAVAGLLVFLRLRSEG